MKKSTLKILILTILLVICLVAVGCKNTEIADNSYSSVVKDLANTPESELNTTPDNLTPTRLNTLSIRTSAYFYLDRDWIGVDAFSKSLSISCGTGKMVYIDLRGHSMSVGAGYSVINVNSGTLVLFDSVGGGTITGAKQKKFLGGGGVYIANGATLELYSGVNIIDNETLISTYLGGGIYNAGTLDMYGGKIANNKSAGIGGGVYNIGTFNMYNGTVSGNASGASRYGGGVYNAGIFNMINGTISGNTAFVGGGGVSNVGTMTMSCGTISGNSASGSGAGIFVAGDSKLTITSGTISANTSSSNGGAIAVSGDNATINITDCVISNNVASGNGSGIAISGENTSVSLKDCDITTNIANGNGGGVYLGEGNLYVSGETNITGNINSTGKNNLYVVEGEEVVITGKVNGTIGVTCEKNTDEILTTDDYTIDEDTASSFESDNDDYHSVWSKEENKLIIVGEGELDYNFDVEELVDGTATFIYDKAGYDVSNLFELNPLAEVTYTSENINGSATLNGSNLNVESIGTFVITASVKPTLTFAGAKGKVTLKILPMEVSIGGIEALSRGVNKNNFYVDLDQTRGTITDANGTVLTEDIYIDYTSAFGAIDNREYFNDPILNGPTASNIFDVTIFNIKLGGQYSGNYVISTEDITTKVKIFMGYPLVSWPSVSNIIYGTTLDNHSLIGGKVMIKVDSTYYPVDGDFEWVETPLLENVGKYTRAVKFVVDSDTEHYNTIKDYVENIQALTHYISYSVNAKAVTFDISNTEINTGDSLPTITATADGEEVSQEHYKILYYQLKNGIEYYSVNGKIDGDGSYENPYLLDTNRQGIFYIGAELDNNYRHSGSADSIAKQIGVLYINESNVSNYNITFVDSDTNIEIYKITDSYVGSIIIMPSCDQGIGWVNEKGIFYEFGERYAQPKYDEVFSLVKSNFVTISGTITGIDLDETDGTLDSIVVQLMQGSNTIMTAETDYNGTFTFEVPKGNYTLVVTRRLIGLTNIQTIMVSAQEDIADIVVDLPSTRHNVVLDVDAGYTNITVDGIEQLVPIDNNTITIAVERTDNIGSEKLSILDLAQKDGYSLNNVKLYYDINFTEQPFTTELALAKLDSQVDFCIPLTGIYQGKKNYAVYVYDDYGNTYKLDSENYTCNGRTLELTTDIAGVYALAYEDVVNTISGTDKSEVYSDNAIDLSTMFENSVFDNELVDLTGARYILGDSSTGFGIIEGNLLYVDKVGKFEIIITTLETATMYSCIGTATLTVNPARISIINVGGVDRGLIENYIAVELDITNMSAFGVINNDKITLNFTNAYGMLVRENGGTDYFDDYDKDASSWENHERTFDVLIVGAVLEGQDSSNYSLVNSYTLVTISSTVPYVAWPTSTTIAYGEQLSDDMLYGGKVVIYDGDLKEYVHFPTEDCTFVWGNEEYKDDFDNILDFNDLNAGEYTQKVTVTIKESAEGYKEGYNDLLVDRHYYVDFEIVADAVRFEISNNIISVGEDVQLLVVAKSSSDKIIGDDKYECVFFKLDNGIVYYSLNGKADGDGSYENPYLLSTDKEDTYYIASLFNLSNDGVYNYHHSGSLDSTAKQIGTLYITNSVVNKYTATFEVEDKLDSSITYNNTTSGSIIIMPTLEDENYIGWSYKDVVYSFGARFVMPENHVVFSAVASPEKYEVSGIIKGVPLGVVGEDATAIPVSGVGVALYQGSELVSTTSTDSSGRYAFDVVRGKYNLVITRTHGIENIITKYLFVGGDTEVAEIEIPNIRQNTIVSVDSGLESVVVEGGETLHTDEENTITISLTDASNNVEILDMLRAVAKLDGIQNADMKVYIDITLTSDYGSIIQLENDKFLTFYISLSGLYQGYDNYFIYRYHTNFDGTVSIEKITTTANENGEYISLNADGTALILKCNKFSTFGIAFTNNEIDDSTDGNTPEEDDSTDDNNSTDDPTDDNSTSEEDSCPQCEKCPTFLGLCIWLWIELVLVLALVITGVVLTILSYKEKKRTFN